ncbi:angel [Drosophila busckii]|uniref:Angel n=2 Tax=Drosophila busckii TaxID=30019 RepID=A0A0M4EK48_DROBS|nr:angel [Drosophila busckii]
MEPRYDFNRKWKRTLKEPCRTQACFKLLCYNVLAQDLLTEHIFLYEKIDQQFLRWHKRLMNLQQELMKLDADIMCLQEMQYDHLPILVQQLSVYSKKRLEYLFKKKTGYRTDGCAIIYDSSKLQLLKQQSVELYDQKLPLLDRANVAQLAKFKLKHAGKEFIVANTHLLFNPRRDDVRCAQLARLLKELCEFREDTATPIVIMGDFNSMPNSTPIELITKEPTDDTTPHFEAIDFGKFTASTYQNDWVTVDYMMRSKCPQLQVQSVYQLPTINSCANVGPIPNRFLGSDHYVLGAVFAFA